MRRRLRGVGRLGALRGAPPGEPLTRLLPGFVVTALLAAAGCGAGNESAPLGGDLTLEQARAFGVFPLYYVGDAADGLPLVAILRRDDTADYVSFVYGDCLLAAGDQGCAPPAEIQVWRGCRRSSVLYDRPTQGALVGLERAKIRGAPAVLLDDGRRAELFTRDATIVVFADSRERALRLADSLRLVGARRPSGDLPAAAPDPGDGSSGC